MLSVKRGIPLTGVPSPGTSKEEALLSNMMDRSNNGGDEEMIVGLNAALQKRFILPATSKKIHHNIEIHNGKDKAASTDIGPHGNQEQQQASTDGMR